MTNFFIFFYFFLRAFLELCISAEQLCRLGQGLLLQGEDSEAL
jgi:hypothetical protein